MWPGGPYGRTLHFGIREHAMGAILNGITVHGGTRAYGGTFLVFSDYMRPPVRLAALMKLPSIFVWTHDSIGLGGDGPTHQPIEHLAVAAGDPRLRHRAPGRRQRDRRRAGARILEKTDGPAGIALSRQNLPVLDPDKTADAGRGAYVLEEALVRPRRGHPHRHRLRGRAGPQGPRALLEDDGTPTRVVSMPCMEWFEAQPASYQQEVLPPEVKARVSVEAARQAGLARVGRRLRRDRSRIEHFGASAEGDVLFEQFGFTPDRVVAAAHSAINRAGLIRESTTGN